MFFERPEYCTVGQLSSTIIIIRIRGASFVNIFREFVHVPSGTIKLFYEVTFKCCFYHKRWFSPDFILKSYETSIVSARDLIYI